MFASKILFVFLSLSLFSVLEKSCLRFKTIGHKRLIQEQHSEKNPGPTQPIRRKKTLLLLLLFYFFPISPTLMKDDELLLLMKVSGSSSKQGTFLGHQLPVSCS